MPNVVIDGAVYHYSVKLPKKDPECAIVFVHGAGGSHKHWFYQVEGLGDRYLALALDLPGHGKSGGAATDKLEEYTDFVYNFCRHVLGTGFYLAGHSMGGAITMDFALNYAEDLQGIILIGTGARLRVAPAMLQTFASGKKFPQMIDFAYGNGASQKTLEIAKQEMEATDAQVYYKDFQACDNFDIMDRLHLLKSPCLILGASEDKLTPAKYSLYLAEKIQNSKVDIIDNAGHMMMLERHQEVNIKIEQFITERSELQ
ncbi:Pimeloyl-ACP methyl ester carboxylesterase [Desulfotomaculum arcticum]|uniref:Pimeloyl-ACP methyl ester carboxylesterase n=1 Tax=Desulfotruncus arcticus DSM 17038 TaxID=1121424 RepID=A0A1I2S1Z8_9FIRM|nr:Pimeloyl-ACP methyl ester carboxylesterase [Desulfotomaculum arcticum] [Desulfotruncus arcticus DSM 17038]